jgi:hypothetical protein
MTIEWLSLPDVAFPERPRSPEDVDLVRLRWVCLHPTLKVRHLHQCRVCGCRGAPDVARSESVGGGRVYGNGICIVQLQKGRFVVFYDMLYHYVVEHGYQPPDDVRRAIEAAASPLNKVLTFLDPWRHRRVIGELGRKEHETIM